MSGPTTVEVDLVEELWPQPQPLPTDLPDVDPFDPALIPEGLRGWVADIADRMQCPMDFPAIASVLSVSSVVGRRISIFPKRHDDWRVTPNLWGGVVGRPGLMKSPALSEPKRMLERLEAEAREQYEDDCREYAARQMVAKISAKEAEKDIVNAIKDKDAAHRLALNALSHSDEEEPTKKRYVTNDATVEKLGELLRDNPNGMLVFRDELVGLLRGLEREGQESSRAFYLEAWNGDSRFTYDRIGRGTVEIEAACVSILGGIQPGPLRRYMQDMARGGAGDDGLMQRFQLLVWPGVTPNWVNIDRKPDALAKERVWKLFQRLDCLSPETTGAEVVDGEVPALRFDDEAQIEFDAWRANLEQRLRGDELPPVLEAHLSKYRSLIPSLALLFHLVDAGHGPVPVSQLVRALAWAEYLEKHASRVYAQAVDHELSSAIELSRRIRQGSLPNPFTLRALYRNQWRLLDRKESENAVKYLEDLDHLRIVSESSPNGGRPSMVCHINPMLLKGKR